MKAINFLSRLFLVILLISTLVTSAINASKQPEYLSFQSGSKDNVNLLTGDLSFGMPLLTIPSPEGGYPVQLTYSSGIRPEDEAGWVGLGWGLNVGSINRDISMYPDDYHGAIVENKFKDPGYVGELMNWVFYKQHKIRGQNHDWGMVNLVGLQFGWGDAAGISAVGVTIDWSTNPNPAEVDPVGTILSVVNIIVSIYSYGTASSVLSAIAWDIGIGIAGIVIGDVLTSISADGSSVNLGHWTIQQPKKNLGVNVYNVFLNHVQKDRAWGTLYLGGIETYDRIKNSYGPSVLYAGNQNWEKMNPMVGVHDFVLEKNDEHLWNNWGATHLTYDTYNVLAPGITGNISPYRHDQGSLSYPGHEASEITQWCALSWANETKLYGIPHIGAKYKLIGDYPGPPDPPSTQVHPVKYDGKVEFRYLGENSNYYNYHLTGNRLNNPTIPVLHSQVLNPRIQYTECDGDQNDCAGLESLFTFLDSRIDDQRAVVMESDRDGLVDNQLMGANHIAWYTNQELEEDFGYDREGYPKFGIGSIRITRPDGTTYYFDQPVYNRGFTSYSGNGVTGEDEKSGTLKMTQDYAIHWLLTAITNSDYIDNGDNLVNEGDLGGWVKFNYARFTSDYVYRTPYNNDDLLIPPDGNTEALFSVKGRRDQVYLNSIKTRTHTAIFVKDVKKDGRGWYYTNTSAPATNTNPASSLLLKEIILLTNEDFEEITTRVPDSLHQSNGGNQNNYIDLLENEAIHKMWDVKDIESASSIRQFLDSHQVQRIVFNQDYSLCPKTLNSFHIDTTDTVPPRHDEVYYGNKLGKLTLKNIYYYGRYNKIAIPSFDFAYSKDTFPYNANRWDQWGMYNTNNPSHLPHTHGVYTSSVPGRAEDYWCLKEMTRPDGIRMVFNIERDNYSSVAGHPTRRVMDITLDNYNQFGEHYIYTQYDEIHDFLTTNDTIEFALFVEYSDESSGWYICKRVITAIDSNARTFTVDEYPVIPGGEVITKMTGSMAFTVPQLSGGDQRVASIDVIDEFGRVNTTKYDYTLFNDSLTSGVVSTEPIWGRNEKYPFYNYYDWPTTSVLYKNVSVYKNYNLSDSSFLKKYEFEFETPHSSQIQQDIQQVAGGYGPSFPHKRKKGTQSVSSRVTYHYRMGNNVVLSNRYVIGRLKSIREYTSKNHKINSTNYYYRDMDDYITRMDSTADITYHDTMIPGLRTEASWLTHGVLHHEKIGYKSLNPRLDMWWYFHFHKTSKLYFPNNMYKVEVDKNGFKYTIENVDYDNNTGIILAQTYNNNLGYNYLTEKELSYSIYPELGSKIIDIENRNILGASSVDKLKVYNGITDHWDLLRSVASTWSKDWNTTGDVWRRKAQYIWKYQINRDGTLIESASPPTVAYEDFDFSPTASNVDQWHLLSENTTFNDYSLPLETKGVGHYHEAKLTDNRNEMVIMEAKNARYEEITYCGFENDTIGIGEFDGGLILSSGASVVSDVSASCGGSPENVYPHTGKNMVELSPGDSVIVVLEAGQFEPFRRGREFRLFVWQNNCNYSNNKPEATVNIKGGGWTEYDDKVTIIQHIRTENYSMDEECNEEKRYGNWHLLETKFIAENFTPGQTHWYVTKMKINLKNSGSGNIYLDDIRVQPYYSTAVSMVYDNETKTLSAELNNWNIGKKYEYYYEDYKCNRLKQVFSEFADASGPNTGGFIKVLEKDYNIVK